MSNSWLLSVDGSALYQDCNSALRPANQDLASAVIVSGLFNVPSPFITASPAARRISIRPKDTPEIPKLLLEGFPKKDDPEFIEIESIKLLILLHSIDRWSNITTLCKAIVNHLDGQPLNMPELRPQSPFYSNNDLNKGEATLKQVDEFLAEPFPNFTEVKSR
jgi:hypothetical protein